MNIPLASFFPYLILAAIGFLIGLAIARLLWRGAKSEALRLERDNRELEAEHEGLERAIADLESRAA